MNMRLKKLEVEEELMSLFLFLGAVIAGLTLGQVLHDVIHKIAPRATSWPAWEIVLLLVITVSCAVGFRTAGLRWLFISLAISFFITLLELIYGAGLFSWIMVHALSFLVAGLALGVGLKRNGRIGHVVALFLGLAAVVGRFLILERWG